MQLVLFELVCGLVVTHDPAHIVNGYTDIGTAPRTLAILEVRG